MAMTKEEIISKLKEILNGDEYASKVESFINLYKDNKQYSKIIKLDKDALKNKIDKKKEEVAKQLEKLQKAQKRNNERKTHKLIEKYKLNEANYKELQEIKIIVENLLSEKKDKYKKQLEEEIKERQIEIDNL
jgi:hypothetical protein